MATLSSDNYTVQLKLGKDPLNAVRDVLIGAACSLEGVSAVLAEFGEEEPRIGSLAYAADEAVCLQRRLLNSAADLIAKIQHVNYTNGTAPGEGA